MRLCEAQAIYLLHRRRMCFDNYLLQLNTFYTLVCTPEPTLSFGLPAQGRDRSMEVPAPSCLKKHHLRISHATLITGTRERASSAESSINVVTASGPLPNC